MNNDELRELMINRKRSQIELKATLASLKGLGPMDVMTGKVDLPALSNQLETTLSYTDQALTELVMRSLNNG
jgi:hypothetical protein